jgi:uncharacterized protein YpmS
MTKMGRRNWKRAFFILLGSVLITGILVVGFITYLLVSKPSFQSEFISPKEDVTPFFTLSTSKAAINVWIREELAKKEKTVENINYEVVLEDFIYLRGNLIVFNREIPFQMVFHPHVNEDGGLTLQEREISLGRLQLPGELVISLIDEQIDFPKWVSVEPSRREISVNVKRIQLDDGMQLSVKRFDLQKDQLEFILMR